MAKETFDCVQWKYWVNIPTVTLWEACLLSLGLNPKTMRQLPAESVDFPSPPPYFKSSAFPSEAVETEYEMRLELLRRNIGVNRFFSSCKIDERDPNYAEISLCKFTSWGLSIPFTDMPRELVAIAQNSGAVGNDLIPKDSAEAIPIQNADDWKTQARKIGERINLGNKKLSVDKIAKKVHEEMVDRQSKGEKGMTGRGGKIPCADSIKRHALAGIKT